MEGEAAARVVAAYGRGGSADGGGGVSLRVSHGRRYGLVGPNGKSKSSLLKLLDWRKLLVPRSIRVMLVVLEDRDDDPHPVIEVVLAADEELTKLRAEREELEASGDVLPAAWWRRSTRRSKYKWLEAELKRANLVFAGFSLQPLCSRCRSNRTL